VYRGVGCVWRKLSLARGILVDEKKYVRNEMRLWCGFGAMGERRCKENVWQ
jgi:hypothetical protein